MSKRVASPSDWLSRATRQTGVTLVGSYGRTTGGSVPGGIVGYSQPAYEFTSVSAPLRSTLL